MAGRSATNSTPQDCERSRLSYAVLKLRDPCMHGVNTRLRVEQLFLVVLQRSDEPAPSPHPWSCQSSDEERSQGSLLRSCSGPTQNSGKKKKRNALEPDASSAHSVRDMHDACSTCLPQATTHVTSYTMTFLQSRCGNVLPAPRLLMSHWSTLATER